MVHQVFAMNNYQFILLDNLEEGTVHLDEDEFVEVIKVTAD